MILKKDFSQIGFLSRTHGYKGNLYAKSDYDLEDLIENLDLPSFFIEIDGLLVPFMVDEVAYSKKDLYIIHFCRIDNEEKASRLIGCPILLPTNQILDLYGDDALLQNDLSLLDGYTVLDALDSSICYGKVIGNNGQTENPLLIILYDGQEKYLPAVQEMITQIDREQKKILVTIPDGLFE